MFSTGGGAKDKTGAPKTPPLNMNHVTVQNPQNDNEVEEMETQEGESGGELEGARGVHNGKSVHWLGDSK